MRAFLGGLCAVVALAIGWSPAAANSASTPVHKAPAQTPAPSTACLGGVIAEGAAGSYLTFADYPAFVTLAAGARRVFICGDSIPSFLPSAERVGFSSRHH